MAEGIRISQLPTITAMTDDDNLIVNDGNSATSRITYANFKSEISGAIAGVNTINGQSGDIVIDSTSLGVYNVQQVNDLITTRASNALIGVVNGATDLGAFAGNTIPSNVTVRSALQALETAVEAGDAQDAILSGNNTFTGENTFSGTITAAQNGNVIPFYFDSQVDFPSASGSHGAVAHSHADGKMYFAHGGSWVELANAGQGDDFIADNYYTKIEVDASVASRLSTSGGSVNGALDVTGGLFVSGVNSNGSTLSVSGPVFASTAQLGSNLDTVPVPFIATNDQDVTTKKYVDDAITAAGSVDLSGYYTSDEIDSTLGGYYTSNEVDVALSSYYTSAQVDVALSNKADSSDLANYSTTTQANALYATAAQGALAESALQDATAFATAAQGTTADSALQPAAIGTTVQAYDVNTVVDAGYSTVQSGAALGATSLQAETLSLTDLKTVVADSTDFADFQSKVAAL